MSFDFAEIYQKDSIKLNFLRDVLDKNIKLEFKLDGANFEDYESSIHSEQSRVKVYGNFNISEDPSGEILTIRVVTIKAPLKISLKVPEEILPKKISVFRSSTKSTENEYEITNLTEYIELIPKNESYSIKISSKPEAPMKLENELSEIKSRVEADEEVIKYYDSQDVRKIFNEIKPKLSEAENIIRSLIEARGKKMMEIEAEIK